MGRYSHCCLYLAPWSISALLLMILNASPLSCWLSCIEHNKEGRIIFLFQNKGRASVMFYLQKHRTLTSDVGTQKEGVVRTTMTASLIVVNNTHARCWKSSTEIKIRWLTLPLQSRLRLQCGAKNYEKQPAVGSDDKMGGRDLRSLSPGENGEAVNAKSWRALNFKTSLLASCRVPCTEGVDCVPRRLLIPQIESSFFFF